VAGSHSKGCKTRLVPVTDEWMAELARYRRARPCAAAEPAHYTGLRMQRLAPQRPGREATIARLHDLM